jgi:hypothetical protein
MCVRACVCPVTQEAMYGMLCDEVSYVNNSFLCR